MQNALQISHWLRDGVSDIPASERSKLHLLLSRYPCFLPLQALDAAAGESPLAGAEAVHFSGLNPVLLQLLKSRRPLAATPEEETAEAPPEPTLPAETIPETPEEVEILVHLPASEDTGEVTMPEAEMPEVTALPAENTVGEDLPAEPENIEDAAPGAVPAESAPLPVAAEAGVLTGLPASEDTGEVNLPEAEALEAAPEKPEAIPTESSAAGADGEGPQAESAPEEVPAPVAEEIMPAPSEKESAAASLSAPDSHTAVSSNQNASPVTPSLPAGEEAATAEDPVIQPLYANDYFLHQGVSNGEDTLPKSGTFQKQKSSSGNLMIMRSFAEWLRFFQSLKTEASEEEAARKAVKASWQKERLAAALEEEEEEIPEVVFEMALNSIAPEGNMISEPLALIYAKQGKWEKAVEIYQRLQLRNPQKSAYFAEKIAVLEQQHRP